MNLQYAIYTNKGKREINEDCLDTQFVNSNLLSVIADGLGGHENGEVASRIAVDAIFQYLSDKDYDEDELIYALLDANNRIIQANISGHSTAAALWIHERSAIVCHVGDTRIYQFRNGKIEFQSVDHSLIQLAVLVGDLSSCDLRHHKDRNKLYRVLGDPETDLKPSSDEIDAIEGDRFLLCSDGFWEAVTEEDMIESLRISPTPDVWLEKMIQIVENTNDPKQDNYTAVCIYCGIEQEA